MTSWSDKELIQLCDPDNHKIVYDGYDYRWCHNITSKWEIHSLSVFEDFSKAYSWLFYWLAEWSKELTSRRIKEARKNKGIQGKIRRICEELDYNTHQKVLEIHKLNPKLSHNEIALMLDVSKQMVGRYVKDAA